MLFHPRSLLLLFTILVFFVFAVPEAEACRCFAARNLEGKNFQPCGTYSSSDAVFIGTVQTTTLEMETFGDTTMPGMLTAHFSVDKAIRGVEGKSISIKTNGNGGMCGYPFKEGETYFVYVKKNERGELEARLCGGTVLLKDAQVDLEYVKAIEAGEKGARVYGTVSRVVRPSMTAGWGPVGLSGIKVSLESIEARLPSATSQPKYVKVQFETMTDVGGFYIFYGIPDGLYAVKPDIPSTLRPFGENNPGQRSIVRIDSDKYRCASSRFAATSLPEEVFRN